MSIACHPRTSLPSQSAFTGYRFPAEIIVLAVRWYLRYGLSYRDTEELLCERGVDVDHVTVYRWVQRFTPLLADAARPCRHSPGDRWFVDETYVKVNGVWRYVYRSRLKHRLRPMRGLRTDRSAAIIIAGLGFMQNIRRGHYELGVEAVNPLRVATAFSELAEAI